MGRGSEIDIENLIKRIQNTLHMFSLLLSLSITTSGFTSSTSDAVFSVKALVNYLMLP